MLLCFFSGQIKSPVNVKGSWSGWHEEKFLESCENPKSVYCLSDYIFYQELLIKDDNFVKILIISLA